MTWMSQKRLMGHMWHLCFRYHFPLSELWWHQIKKLLGMDVGIISLEAPMFTRSFLDSIYFRVFAAFLLIFYLSNTLLLMTISPTMGARWICFSTVSLFFTLSFLFIATAFAAVVDIVTLFIAFSHSNLDLLSVCGWILLLSVLVQIFNSSSVCNPLRLSSRFIFATIWSYDHFSWQTSHSN